MHTTCAPRAIDILPKTSVEGLAVIYGNVMANSNKDGVHLGINGGTPCPYGHGATGMYALGKPSSRGRRLYITTKGAGESRPQDRWTQLASNGPHGGKRRMITNAVLHSCITIQRQKEDGRDGAQGKRTGYSFVEVRGGGRPSWRHLRAFASCRRGQHFVFDLVPSGHLRCTVILA